MPSSKEFLKKVTGSVMALLSADLLSFALMALFSIVYGRYFGEFNLGLYTNCFLVATFSRTLSELAYDLRIPREVAKAPELAGKIIIDSQRTKNLIWIVIVAPTAAIGYTIAGSWEFLPLLAWNYIYSVSATLKAALRGLGRMRTISKVETTGNIALYAFCFASLFLCPSLWLIFAFYGLAEAGKAFAYSRITGKINSRHESLVQLMRVPSGRAEICAAYREAVAQARLLGVNFSSVLQFRSSFLTIAWFSGNAMAGSFSAAMRFLTMLRIIPGAVLNTLLPEFSRRERPSNRAIVLVFAASLGAGAAISLGLFFSADFLMNLTFKFESSVPALKILSFSFIPVMLSNTIEALLIAGRHEKFIVASLILSAVLIFGGIVACPRSLVAISCTVVAGESFLALCYTAKLFRRYGAARQK